MDMMDDQVNIYTYLISYIFWYERRIHFHLDLIPINETNLVFSLYRGLFTSRQFLHFNCVGKGNCNVDEVDHVIALKTFQCVYIGLLS